MSVIALADCGGGGGTEPSASTPFSGTWSGTIGNLGQVPMTLTLTQNGSSLSGTSVIQCDGCGSGQSNVRGTINGNTATVAITHLDGSALVPAATLTLSGSSMSMQWVGGDGRQVTSTMTHSTTPTTPTAPSTSQTPESFCGALPTAGFGKFFFCGSAQGNLQGGLPNGWMGYCMTADTNNLGLVGYSATTFAGGADVVRSFSDAQATCDGLNTGGLRQCGSIIRCTRLP